MEKKLLEELLVKARTALRITTTAFDEEIRGILEAGYLDLKTRGVLVEDNAEDPMVIRALMTYTRYHFGDPDNAERLKASYDEQKAQLMTTTGYTEWSGD